MIVTNAFFRQYKGIVDSYCWRLARRYDFADVQELRARGYLILMESCQDFDPTLGEFSTHLYHKLGELTRPFDPRAKHYQTRSATISENTPIGNDGETLADVLGEYDSNMGNMGIFSFIYGLGEPEKKLALHILDTKQKKLGPKSLESIEGEIFPSYPRGAGAKAAKNLKRAFMAYRRA